MELVQEKGVYYRQHNQRVKATKPLLSDVEPQDTVFALLSSDLVTEFPFGRVVCILGYYTLDVSNLCFDFIRFTIKRWHPLSLRRNLELLNTVETVRGNGGVLKLY